MPTSLPLHGDLAPVVQRPAWSVAGKGFRPFFLLAAAFAAAIVPVWLLVLRGTLAPGYFGAASWHAHEMVFGFAVAVVAGFLLTAVGNWTHRETLIGWPLLGLAGLWLAGRFAIALALVLPRGAAAGVDLAFLPALSIALARPLLASGHRRNLILVAVLGLLALANAAMHAGALGIRPGWSRPASLFAVDLLVLLVVIIAGRVFPMFTRNATGSTTVRSHVALEGGAVASVALVAVLDFVAPYAAVTGVAAAVAAALTGARAAGWFTPRAARHPLLWVLYAGYAWVPAGLLLRAASIFTGTVTPAIATHALTVGVLGTVTLGMMARVTLGHTGRVLAAPRVGVASFVLIAIAAAVRVVGPLASPLHHFTWLVVSGSLWSAAFTLYLWAFAPALLGPRVDGRPG